MTQIERVGRVTGAEAILRALERIAAKEQQAEEGTGEDDSELD
jgi:hypothetical protein